MNYIFVIFAVVVCANATPRPGIISPILSTSYQYHNQDTLGQYQYGYGNAQSAKSEMKTADGITQGSYSYIDPEGKLQAVQYVSDDNGFRVNTANSEKVELKAPAIPAIPATKIIQAPLPTAPLYYYPELYHIAAPQYYRYLNAPLYAYPQYYTLPIIPALPIAEPAKNNEAKAEAKEAKPQQN